VVSNAAQSLYVYKSHKNNITTNVATTNLNVQSGGSPSVKGNSAGSNNVAGNTITSINVIGSYNNSITSSILNQLNLTNAQGVTLGLIGNFSTGALALNASNNGVVITSLNPPPPPSPPMPPSPPPSPPCVNTINGQALATGPSYLNTTTNISISGCFNTVSGVNVNITGSYNTYTGNTIKGPALNFQTASYIIGTNNTVQNNTATNIQIQVRTGKPNEA
jgi:hypothetical protein